MEAAGVSEQKEDGGGGSASDKEEVKDCEEPELPVAAGKEGREDGTCSMIPHGGEEMISSTPVSAGGISSCVAGNLEASVMRRGSNAEPSDAGDDGISQVRAPQWCFSDVLEFEKKCDFFKIVGLSKLCKVDFPLLCREVSSQRPSILQLGVSTLQLLLICPRDGKSISSWIATQFCHSSFPPTRVRDVLPLPLPPVGAALKLLSCLKATRTGLLTTSSDTASCRKKQGRQQLKRLVTVGCQQLWRFLVVLIVNGLNDDWKYLPWRCSTLTPTQSAAFENIDRWVEAFCKEPQKEIATPVFSELVKGRTMDYSGEEVGHALPLRLEELEPGLPVAGTAGSLSAVAT